MFLWSFISIRNVKLSCKWWHIHVNVEVLCSTSVYWRVMISATDWYSRKEASTVPTAVKHMQPLFLTSTQNKAFVLLYPQGVTFTGNPLLKLIARVSDWIYNSCLLSYKKVTYAPDRDSPWLQCRIYPGAWYISEYRSSVVHSVSSFPCRLEQMVPLWSATRTRLSYSPAGSSFVCASSHWGGLWDVSSGSKRMWRGRR